MRAARRQKSILYQCVPSTGRPVLDFLEPGANAHARVAGYRRRYNSEAWTDSREGLTRAGWERTMAGRLGIVLYWIACVLGAAISVAGLAVLSGLVDARDRWFAIF